MEAKELRIGNFAEDQNGNLLKVVSLNETDILFKVVDRSKFPLPNGWQAEPIPITEEWLVKFGFERINEREFRHTEYFYNLERGWFGICEGIGMEIVFDMKYVHQLQNLYFALTGNELQPIK